MRAFARGHLAQWGVVALATLTVMVLIGACSGSSPRSKAATPATRVSPPEDLVLTANDFHSLQSMTKIRGFFVDNRLGHLAETVRVANSTTGGNYPVGTIIQLVPQEAMVKRRPGFSPASRDWEFFTLKVNAQGTQIARRGGAEVINQFGGSCTGCHSAAEPRFDMVCEHTHGCAPLPISDAIIAAIQQADPRPAVP
jgi:Fe-S cluster biogenesis protein NfuA